MNNNRITSLEGLTNCPRLEELHLSNQIFENASSTKESFQIDLPSIQNLSTCLRILHLENCQLHSQNISNLKGLYSLEILNLRNNHLEEVDQVITLLQTLSQLTELDIRENSLMENTKVREKIIIFSKRTLSTYFKNEEYLINLKSE